MKYFLKLIVLLIAINFASPAYADICLWKDSIEYEAYNNKYVRIKSSHQDIRIPNIPEIIEIDNNNYIVDSIAERAFFNSKILSLSIPTSIRSIGEKAFYGCKGVTSLDIPSSVTFIGDNAFEKCTSIESLSISSSLTRIGEGTFYDCYALTDVTIPSSVNYIGKSAFSNCHSMESVTIPATVDSIGSYAFYACDALKTVTIPSSVKKIGECSFWNCKSLESTTISSSVEEIERGTFYGCHSLASVVIPNSITKIGERAFEQCINLPYVIFPPYVTAIDEDAFKMCEALNTIVSYPTTPPSVGKNAFFMVPADAIVYVPAEALDQYPSLELWNGFHDFRALGSIELTINSSELNLHIGEKATLNVSIEKAFDVEIISEEWTTSDPEVAIVENGIVSAVGDGTATISFVVIDGTGCPHVAVCEVYVDNTSGIEGISDEDNNENSTIEYYNLNGVRINSDALAPGLYIKKEGKRSVKILVM